MHIDYPIERFKRAEIIGFDIETYDPNLRELGPGVFRTSVEGGKILGVSLSVDGFAEYYNVGHYDCDDAERTRNMAFIREVLSIPTALKIGHSIQYDLDWLENGPDAVQVVGKLGAVDIAEALLDEVTLEYNLDYLGKKYLNIGKRKSVIDRFCEENGLQITSKKDARAWLYKMPYKIAREYAIGDAQVPLQIWKMQQPLIDAQELTELYELECELLRVLILMRKTGVLLDQDKRDRNGLEVQNLVESIRIPLFEQYGEFNYNSSAQIAGILDREGIAYPRTEKGNPSINDYFYKRYAEEYPLVDQIAKLRKASRIGNNFIMGSHVKFVGPDGLIHAQFHSLKNDNFGALKGTRSGRFSSTNPNLQQQPSVQTDEYYGTLCRSDFIPFPGHRWGKIDYSQIEYRFIANFAMGPGAEALRAAYNANPDTDYHQFIVELTGLTRRFAKNLNFGVGYGMGAAHMAEFFGWDLSYCYEILNIYHTRAPYIKVTMKEVEKVARRRGYIKTFLKRRSHLVDPSKGYTMFCRLIQGSAADLMKKAMLATYHAGLYDVLKLHITVHDELDVSVPETRAGVEAFSEMKHIMETALTLKVPIRAEAEIGTNWADVHEFDRDALLKEIA